MQITSKVAPYEISEYIKILREQKGKEKETLAIIDKSLVYGHDFVINLFWEKALVYQHMFMNDPSNKKLLNKMETAILEAKYWIEKNKMIRWYSRLYRFLGRISDYKGRFGESLALYKKSIKFVNKDPEPFRILELKAFLNFAETMSGNVGVGYRNAKKLFEDFEVTKVGKELKRKDFFTWAVWRSGITIRTVSVLLDKKYNFEKREIREWIAKTIKDLEKGDFGYRKKELKEIEKRLQG